MKDQTIKIRLQPMIVKYEKWIANLTTSLRENPNQVDANYLHGLLQAYKETLSELKTF